MMTSPATRLHLSALLPPGGSVHVVRTRYQAGRSCALHVHDFCEFFWIEQGVARHLRPGGEERLETGAFLAVPPAMAHGFATAEAPFTIVNIAMPAEVLAFARERCRGPWPWGEAEDAARPLHLGPAALGRLSAWVDDLRPGAPRLEAEATALVLLREALRHDGDPDADLPAPLRRALAGLAGGELPLELAPPLLAQACGWSVAHLNRVVRAARGCTTTALLDRLRIARAERLLRLDPRPVTGIALACGYPSLPHFYRRFTAACGCPPGTWRQRHRAGILGATVDR